MNFPFGKALLDLLIFVVVMIFVAAVLIFSGVFASEALDERERNKKAKK